MRLSEVIQFIKAGHGSLTVNAKCEQYQCSFNFLHLYTWQTSGKADFWEPSQFSCKMPKRQTCSWTSWNSFAYCKDANVDSRRDIRPSLYRFNKSVFSLVKSAVKVTLLTFAAERRAVAPLLLSGRRAPLRSISSARTALSSKPDTRRCCGRMTGQTDGQTDNIDGRLNVKSSQVAFNKQRWRPHLQHK